MNYCVLWIFFSLIKILFYLIRCGTTLLWWMYFKKRLLHYLFIMKALLLLFYEFSNKNKVGVMRRYKKINFELMQYSVDIAMWIEVHMCVLLLCIMMRTTSFIDKCLNCSTFKKKTHSLNRRKKFVFSKIFIYFHKAFRTELKKKFIY